MVPLCVWLVLTLVVLVVASLSVRGGTVVRSACLATLHRRMCCLKSTVVRRCRAVKRSCTVIRRVRLRFCSTRVLTCVLPSRSSASSSVRQLSVQCVCCVTLSVMHSQLLSVVCILTVPTSQAVCQYVRRCDSSFGSHKSPHAQTGYIIAVNGMPVSWRSAKQLRVAHSTCKAGFEAMHECVDRLLRVNGFILTLCLMCIRVKCCPMPRMLSTSCPHPNNTCCCVNILWL